MIPNSPPTLAIYSKTDVMPAKPAFMHGNAI